jgi:antitoxin ParD1/3/4
MIVMNVSLTPELEELVRLNVQTGRYGSVSDVLGEALRLMDELDRAQSVFDDDVQEKIAAGLTSLRAGEGVDGDAFLAEMDAELAELEGSAKA